MKMNYSRIEKAIEAAKNSATSQGRNRIEEIQVYNGYSEPGYDDDAVIVTGNWNEITEYKNNIFHTIDSIPKRLGDVLEKLGCELEWSDEWTSCDDCGKLVRTSPDSYSWTASFTVDDRGITCHKCLMDDPESHLQSLEDCPDRANTISKIKPADHGYFCYIENLENGFHPGQTDSPTKIAKDLRSKGVYRYLFQIDNVGQFDVHFSCWVHEDEKDSLANDLETDDE